MKEALTLMYVAAATKKKLKEEAEARGMKLYALCERILREWLKQEADNAAQK